MTPQIPPVDHAILTAFKGAFADVSPALADQALWGMAAHWQMVRGYNDNINLTGISDAREAASLHYRDALMAQSQMTAGATLDVGSGGGFPGIPLALAKPDATFVLMEPRRKRASLLQNMVARLGLKHVTVLCARLQDAATPRFAQIVTRATFSDTQDLLHARGWLVPEGRLIAFRSAASALTDEDLQNMQEAGLTGYTSHPYTVGGHRRRLDCWICRTDVGHNKDQT